MDDGRTKVGGRGPRDSFVGEFSSAVEPWLWLWYSGSSSGVVAVGEGGAGGALDDMMRPSG